MGLIWDGSKFVDDGKGPKKDGRYHGLTPIRRPPGMSEEEYAKNVALGKMPGFPPPTPTALATPSATPTPRRTGPIARAGYAIEDAMNYIAPSPTDKAVALVAGLVPGLSYLRGVGKGTPVVGTALDLLSRVPDTNLPGALARTGLSAGAGALTNKLEGQSALGGAVKGFGAGVLGEVPGFLLNPSLYRAADEAAFSKTVQDILPNMKGMAAELQQGKNPINVLRDLSTREELNSRYGHMMDSIDMEIGNRGFTVKGLRNQPKSFSAVKEEINDLQRKGWSSTTHQPLGGEKAALARSNRSKLVASLQKQLEDIDKKTFAAYHQTTSGVPSLGGFGPIANQPTELAKMFREANRQYEKTTALIQFANDPQLLDYAKLKTRRAQELFREKFLGKLQAKLGPIDAKKLENTLFRSPFGREEGLDRPGYIQRAQAALYGGGSSLRARLPFPSRQFPNISHYAGVPPKAVNWLRSLATIAGQKAINTVEGETDDKGVPY